MLVQTQLIETQRIENMVIATRSCLHCSFSLSGTVYVPYGHPFPVALKL